MIRDVTDSTNISHTSVHKVLRQNLEEKKKVCSKLVLKVFMPEHKKEQVFIIETFFNNCEADLTLFGRIITSDELEVFKYDPSTNSQSMQWKRSDKPWHKKARMARSQQKLMLILFFDA